MWAEVSSSAPHFLHNGQSDSPIRWRCLLRVLCPVRRPATALDYVLLKDRTLNLAPTQGPEINSRASLWVLPRPCHQTQCWLTNQCLILLLKTCLETPKAGSAPTNFRAGPSLASSSRSHFFVPQYVQGPNIAPPHAGYDEKTIQRYIKSISWDSLDLFTWLRTGRTEGLVFMRYWNLWIYKIREILWRAEEL